MREVKKYIDELEEIIRVQRDLLKRNDFTAFLTCQRRFHLVLAEIYKEITK